MGFPRHGGRKGAGLREADLPLGEKEAFVDAGVVQSALEDCCLQHVRHA
jgi:hypothetical protein